MREGERVRDGVSEGGRVISVRDEKSESRQKREGQGVCVNVGQKKCSLPLSSVLCWPATTLLRSATPSAGFAVAAKSRCDRSSRRCCREVYRQ